MFNNAIENAQNCKILIPKFSGELAAFRQVRSGLGHNALMNAQLAVYSDNLPSAIVVRMCHTTKLLVFIFGDIHCSCTVEIVSLTIQQVTCCTRFFRQNKSLKMRPINFSTFVFASLARHAYTAGKLSMIRKGFRYRIENPISFLSNSICTFIK